MRSALPNSLCATASVMSMSCDSLIRRKSSSLTRSVLQGRLRANRDPYRLNTKSKMAAITNSAPAVMKDTDPCLDLETRMIVSG